MKGIVWLCGATQQALFFLVPFSFFCFCFPYSIKHQITFVGFFFFFSFFMGVANQRFSSCFEFKLLDVSCFVGLAI
jgi:hypothetical protein